MRFKAHLREVSRRRDNDGRLLRQLALWLFVVIELALLVACWWLSSVNAPEQLLGSTLGVFELLCAPALPLLLWLMGCYLTLPSRHAGAAVAIAEGKLWLRGDGIFLWSAASEWRLACYDPASRELCLENDRETLALGVEGVDQARALLAALGLQSARGPLRCKLSPAHDGLWSLWNGALLVFWATLLFARHALASDGSLPARLVVSALIMAAVGTIDLLLSRWLRSSSLSVASDGILWESGRQRAFASHHDLETVEFAPSRLRLRLREGRLVELPIGGLFDPQQGAAIRQTLERELNERSLDARATPARNALASRQGRSPERWRVALLDQQQCSSYRSAALDDHELLAILDNPAESPEQRLAASLLLLDRSHAYRPRIAQAARETVNPDLRPALLDLTTRRPG